MERFVIEQSDQEFYTSKGGLALVGSCLNRFVNLDGALKKSMPLRHGISHADIIKSYLGLLCQGKSDFEAIAQHEKDEFFLKSLGIDRVPSVARLRQRMDEGAAVWTPVIQNLSVDLLRPSLTQYFLFCLYSTPYTVDFFLVALQICQSLIFPGQMIIFFTPPGLASMPRV
ncbi:MAG: transposase, IS4 family [Magnetococcales bacterium]|nr:transposase, IS4 family [Magnetococcales bacterium]HIJ86039.1 hypothetical protein [Magnetococcales bacterium]